MTKLAKETIHKPFDFDLSEVAAGAEFKGSRNADTGSRIEYPYETEH